MSIKEVTVGTKSLEQLLAECPAGASGDDPGHTMAELAASAGVSVKVATQRLRRLHADGRVIAGRAGRLSIAGVVHRVPVYRLKEEPKRKR